MTFRGFIAVEIQSTPRLEEFSRAVKGTDAPLKMVDLRKIHVTLKFLGDTDEGLIKEIETAMKEAVSGIGPFTVKLKGSGAFPNLKRISVIWAGMEGAEPMVDIAGRLNSRLEHLFKPERKRFSPHVTVARVKGGRNKERLVQVLEDFKDAEFGEQQVGGIVLKKSVLTPQGPIYSDIVRVQLE